ncbi:MAG: hypothetical protein J6O41_02180 [Clostridia bacterium]|nr:hypothetical protein [Clostridia bacterium]
MNERDYTEYLSMLNESSSINDFLNKPDDNALINIERSKNSIKFKNNKKRKKIAKKSRKANRKK